MPLGVRALVLAAGLALAALSPAAVAGPTLLFDPANGRVLYAEDQDDQWHPASLTKIMTAYVVFEAIRGGRIKLDAMIPVSEHALAQPPSKVGLPLGAELSVDTALKALIVKSANDVAVMLAEAVGGSEEVFVRRMNDTARRLGMTRTQFVNPNGLPAADQVTTARDLARLARAVVRDFPEFAPYWAMAEVQIGALKLASHNGLLKGFEGADGLKTGFICDSGYNVVASATRDGRRLMAVVLGEATAAERTVRAAGLLEHGFQVQGWKALFTRDTLESMAIPATAKAATSARGTVMAFECGNRRRPVAKAKPKGRQPLTAQTPAATGTKAAAVSGQPSPPKPKKAAAATPPQQSPPAVKAQ